MIIDKNALKPTATALWKAIDKVKNGKTTWEIWPPLSINDMLELAEATIAAYLAAKGDKP